MTEYICITFGPSEDVARNGWWNRKEYFNSRRAAERCGLDSLAIAGTFGYVVIEDGEDYWEIVDECGAPAHAVSIGCKNHNYFVQPAPKLVYV